MARSERTAKHWPEETPEELVERTRREKGDAEAEIMRRALALPPAPRKKAVPKYAGVKQRVPPAPSGIPPQTKIPAKARTTEPAPAPITPRLRGHRRRAAQD